MQIKEKIALLPTLPGVYQFLDSEGTVIYVGKAKSLRNRVSSYFVDSNNHSVKVRALVRNIADLRHVVVDSEYDALLLENNLIKQLQPKYNILLKDGKTYPWVCVTRERFPRVISTRKFDRTLGEYYGPYASVSMQRAVLELIRTVFPLRSCRYTLTDEAIKKHKYGVCLDFHIGNCCGVCEAYASQKQYMEYVAGAKEILKGNFSEAKDILTEDMYKAAAQMKFELAEKVHKKLDLLDRYSHRSIVVSPMITNVDVVNILIDDQTVFCNRMRVVRGAIVESYTIELQNRLDESKEDLLTFALENFDKLSHEIVIPFEPSFTSPNHTYNMAQRGDKAKLLELSLKNCKLYQVERLKHIEKTDPDRHTNRIMANMAKELDMSVEPRHIECFDNSNIQGHFPVAACVVFKDGKPSKRDYRKFNIKTVVGANDFASMMEIVYRRYSRMVEEGEELPQLIVIDGGKGQLGAAYGALEELGLQDKIKIVGLAKRMEEVFFVGESDPRFLDKRGETLKILMQLRDEAHRFGITFHRNKRSSEFLRSELEDVSGLGKVSIDKLLAKYRTIKRMKEVPLEELVDLVGNQRALALKEWLSGN